MILGRDGIAGLVLLGISLVLVVQSLSLPHLPIVPIGPGFYPRIVLVALALASALLVAQDVLKARRAAPPVADSAQPPARRNYRIVVTAFAIVGAYVWLLPLLGFRIATALFVATLQAALGWPRDYRQWTVLGVIALATTAAAYLVFERYLLVLLPRGTWTDW
jgi:putative tricarboxylic transport membrane protein